MNEDAVSKSDLPLSAEEEKAWNTLVDRGRVIRAPHLARRAAAKIAAEEAAKEKCRREGKTFRLFPRKSRADEMKVVPDRVKRWVVVRYAGVTFRKAAEASGATWLEVQDAKARSEDFRCALAAQEEGSRALMRAKAMSVMEQSQEEGAKVSLPQAQLAMKILSSLDRDHFGEDVTKGGGVGAEDAPKLAGGGFVINLIGDAATAASKPVESKGRALVYTDV